MQSNSMKGIDVSTRNSQFEKFYKIFKVDSLHCLQ